MYARIKKSRNGEYLQIVESKRVDGKPRQRLVLYVGHYDNVEEALRVMPRELRYLRGRATRLKKRTGPTGAATAATAARDAADHAERLDRLQALVRDNPELVA